MPMKDIFIFHIKLRGTVSVCEINGSSPLHLAVEQASSGETLLSLSTDQSGLVGLLRHLHGLGYEFLSIIRVE